jgi:hypothetical protein
VTGTKKPQEGERCKNNDCRRRLAEGVDIHAGSRIVIGPK